MNAECRLERDGTVFRFFLSDKGYNDCGYYWTDANIAISNWCLHFTTSSSFLEFSEVKELNAGLKNLLNGTICKIKTLYFIEPDLQVVLRPQYDIRETGKFSYVKEGCEIEDIKAEFLLFPFLDGVLTEQHYVMPLYRTEIIKLTNYLTEKIEQLDKN